MQKETSGCQPELEGARPRKPHSMKNTRAGADGPPRSAQTHRLHQASVAPERGWSRDGAGGCDCGRTPPEGSRACGTTAFRYWLWSERVKILYENSFISQVTLISFLSANAFQLHCFKIKQTTNNTSTHLFSI